MSEFPWGVVIILESITPNKETDNDTGTLLDENNIL